MKRRNVILGSLVGVVLAAMLVFTGCSCTTSKTVNNATGDLKTDIVGKWMPVTADGKALATDKYAVVTFDKDGKGTVDRRDIAQKNWGSTGEFTYTIEGNTITLNGEETITWTVTSIDKDKLEFDLSMNGVNVKEVRRRVSVDYSKDVIGVWENASATSKQRAGSSYEFKDDGTYIYNGKDANGNAVAPQTCQYYVDGDMIVMKFVDENGNENIVNETIASIKDGKMEWTAVRDKEDGTQSNSTITLQKK